VRIELLAGRSLCSFRVEAGHPTRCDLSLHFFFVRHERSMLSYCRQASLGPEGCRSIVLVSLATWREYLGFISSNMGLCAGRKGSRPHNNCKRLYDAPNTRCRAQSPGNANKTFDVDGRERSSGTADRKHIKPHLPNSTRKGRNPIGAEPSRTRAIAASIMRFHVSVVVAPHPAN
jgi:hypothetical protein